MTMTEEKDVRRIKASNSSTAHLVSSLYFSSLQLPGIFMHPSSRFTLNPPDSIRTECSSEWRAKFEHSQAGRRYVHVGFIHLSPGAVSTCTVSRLSSPYVDSPGAVWSIPSPLRLRKDLARLPTDSKLLAMPSIRIVTLFLGRMTLRLGDRLRVLLDCVGCLIFTSQASQGSQGSQSCYRDIPYTV